MGGLLFSLLGQQQTAGDAVVTVAELVSRYVNYVTMAILIACGMLVVIYAVYIGFQLAKAEDDNQRKQAKAQLIYAIIGVVGIAVIAIMINLVIPILNASRWEEMAAAPGGIPGVVDVLNTVSTIVDVVLKLIATAAVVFAIYVGWQLMKAEDDNKRKQAKMQLLYTVIAAVAVVLINAIAVAVLNALIFNQNSGTWSEGT